jgi:hypothetical protein
MTYNDPQLELYRSASPQRFVHVSDVIEIVMAIGQRNCTGYGCDEGRACPRHARAEAVAERYLRLRARPK